MNKKYILILSVLLFVVARPVFAEIIVGEKSFINTSTLHQILDTTILKDSQRVLQDGLTAQETLQAGKIALDEAKTISDKAVQTLEEKGGIDIIAILKTIGTWFIFFAELMIKIVKWLVAKL